MKGMEYAGLYPARRALDSYGQANPVRVWVVNVGDGQVEVGLFAQAANLLSEAGFVDTKSIVDGVMVWKREVNHEAKR